MISGRDFSFEDEGRERVAIINQAAARYYFGDGSAIGHRFTLEGQSRPFEIVGVVADAKYLTLREQAPRTVYLNAMQESRMFAHRLSIRTAIAPAAVAGDVRRMVDEVFKAGAVASMTTLADQVDAEIVPERLIAVLSTIFGCWSRPRRPWSLWIARLHSVATHQRDRRRMALGATPRGVIGMVLKSAAGIVIAGLIVGVPVAVAGRRAVAGLVANSEIDSMLAIGVAAAAMLVVALVSAFVPARRAALVDPVVALRQD